MLKEVEFCDSCEEALTAGGIRIGPDTYPGAGFVLCIPCFDEHRLGYMERTGKDVLTLTTDRETFDAFIEAGADED
jgi:hypothetical protein